MLKNKNIKIDIDALSDVVRFIENRRKQKNANESSKLGREFDSLARGIASSQAQILAKNDDDHIINHRFCSGGES